MATSNAELMKQAREALKDNWGLAIGTYLISELLNTAASYVPLGNLVLAGPLMLGRTIFTLNLSRGKKAEIGQLFDGFQRFSDSLIAYLIMVAYILLWSLLLIVPGIIAAISYSQVFFILTDDKSIEPMEALKKSQKMMKGYKWKYVCLGLRFFGWFLLCILTFGIGFLWLIPYTTISFAKFYEDLKE